MLEVNTLLFSFCGGTVWSPHSLNLLKNTFISPSPRDEMAIWSFMVQDAIL
jgi:hypothetical protein